MLSEVTEAQAINNPETFAELFLKILDKEKRLTPFRWNKAQAHFHANRTGRDLILKARQLGFSTYVQGEMFRRTVTGTRTTITLAHDADTTAKLRIMADRYWENCKKNDGEQPARKYANASMTTYPEFDSVVTIATAGNVETGRGDTYTDMHGSEVAFWKDAEKIIAGAMQGGSPDVVLESTPNGAQGYFYERCMEAVRGEGVWRLHFYPWWWDDSYRILLIHGEQIELADDEERLVEEHHLDLEQIKWRRNKIAELRGLFRQEYPEDPITCFLTSGNSYFGDMTDVFTAPMNPVYDPTHEYVAGLDFGQTNDFTAMPVLDITAKCQVDLLHVRKLEWKEQRRRVAEMYRKWHCSRMGAERNSIGSVNIEALQDDKLTVIPFDTTNESKAEIMSDLYEGIHTDGWKLQDHPVQRHEMQTFVSTQTPSGLWRLAAEGDGHDDTVMGLGVAKWVARIVVRLPDNQPKQKSKYLEGDNTGWAKKY
jgi:hypothetical protein